MAVNITTKHRSAGDGGVFCRYENNNTGQSSSFYLEEPPCPPSEDIEFGSQMGSQVNSPENDVVRQRFGGGRYSGGTQGQISRGFGSNRMTNLVTGLGGSQIARARVGRTVSYNPLYNKPKYVVSANMRQLRKRKVRSQQPLLKLGARRTQ